MSTQNTNATANTELFKEDGSINNAFANPNDSSQFATSPNTTTDASKSNTGSGLQAPEVNQYDSSGNLILNDAGKPVTEKLQYSWESKADERANLDYQSNILETKASMLENRQQLESQGQQLQNQAAMEQYNRNQSAEKVGWTGGYILDSERQMNYLKQSIQSQMYGQMELQKYGYDTSLAAARLAYDTNRYDLALEYYNTALSRAVTEAEITGYYVSPEASEMLDQYHLASKALNENPEDAQAQSVLKAVYDWFEANGISKNGVETFEHLTQERAYRKALFEEGNERLFQYADGNFAKVDANGQMIGEDINFNATSTSDILKYIENNPTAVQQYYGHLDAQLDKTVQEDFRQWLITHGGMTLSEDKKTYIPEANFDYSDALFQFLQTTTIYKKAVAETEPSDTDSESIKDEKAKLRELYSNWDFDIALPDGTTYTTTLVDLVKTVQNHKVVLNLDNLKDVAQEDYEIKQKTTTIKEGLTITTGRIKTDTCDIILLDKKVKDGLDSRGDQLYFEDTGFGYHTSANNSMDLAESYDEVSMDKTTATYLKNIYHNWAKQDITNGTLIAYNNNLYVYRAASDNFIRVKGKGHGGSNSTDDAGGAQKFLGKLTDWAKEE